MGAHAEQIELITTTTESKTFCFNLANEVYSIIKHNEILVEDAI